MNKNKINSKDLLLCFLYSPGITNAINEPITGRTKLTKMMFLFEKEIYPHFFRDEIDIAIPEFKPYYFGPFSKQLFEDLAFFQSIGMIESSYTSIPISPAEKVELEEALDFDIEDEWVDISLDAEEKFESQYYLTSNGKIYVEDRLWKLLTPNQVEKLRAFKSQINKISLDALLSYVYNKYPEETTASKIANKYLNKEED